ncbi:hypothetical protein [Sciscionella marina]|uniref:hypothetical protein n=1 Tax=Sciscionella marina TaxID=508770 RepID=UPI0012F666BA|nr:hypothetical protein [Sciscionella marina]
MDEAGVRAPSGMARARPGGVNPFPATAARLAPVDDAVLDATRVLASARARVSRIHVPWHRSRSPRALWAASRPG